MSTGLPNSIVTQTILILYNIIRSSPICAVRKTFLLLNTWLHARLGLLDFWSFLFQLSQIFWNISTPFLDVLFVFWTFYIRSMSSCCWFFWCQIAESILNYLLKITLVANTKQHHFMTCSKLKSYCQSLKSAEYWIYNTQYNTHYLTYCDMKTDESGIFL